MHHKRTRKVLQTKSSPKKHKKILPKHLSGRVAHHRHTSYASLFGIMLLTIVALMSASRSVALAQSATDPVTKSEGVYAVVPGPAPQVAATITSPAAGAVYTTNDLITVSGTCEAKTLLKVFKNDVMAGSAFCQNGRYSVQIDLFLGLNTLIVRSYSSTDAEGPESVPVVVRHEVLGASTNQASTSSNQLFLTTEIHYRGISVGDTLAWELTINGGQAPYAVSIGWGDGQTDLISRAASGPFTIRHIYKKAGTGEHSSYNVTITATDQAGNKAFLQLVSIVSGDAQSIAGSVKHGYDLSAALRIAWQLVAIFIAILVSFWLGERRELWLLKRMGKA